jgi:primosomal protein N' (replication factor Y) (superfamily II helicase)
MPNFASVAVPVAVRKTFSYAVPSRLRNRIAVGARVIVPFGRKLLTGFVTDLMPESPSGDYKIKSIRELLDPQPLVSPALVHLALWTAEYYFAPPGETLKALLPPGGAITGGQRLSLSPSAARLMAGGLYPPGLNPHEIHLIEILARQGSMTSKEWLSHPDLHGDWGLVESLAAAKWIQVEDYLERPKVKIREQLGIRTAALRNKQAASLTDAQKRLYAALDAEGRLLPLQKILQTVGTSRTAARSLERKGWVEIVPVQIERIPLDLDQQGKRELLTLTRAQDETLIRLKQMLQRREPAKCLLHGVTGSGKTEIYLQLIAEALKMGEAALLLVPEIGLTPLLSRIAVSHFPDRVSLLHSGMSAGERHDQWNRIRSGHASVVVGTRSAVFAPLDNLRLIIIDEEQDGSYKQDESPCYHAREVAWQRVRQSRGVLLLGSATPSLETYHAAMPGDTMVYLNLPERIESRPLPEVTIVDMSREFHQRGKKTVVSEALRIELEACLNRGEQSIILLNRRGYSRSLICRSCGHVFSCSQCSVSMTYHQDEGCLTCHYCAEQKAAPSSCDNCGGEFIYYTGVGTEQLDEILRSMFPKARVARVDRDTTRRQGAMRRILLEFSEGKLDLLVGTQMVAKGHDFPNVTLVGVIGADAGLAFPDFRSAERTFQLLTQVAGRAGRGTTPGRVIVQSYQPDHYALQYARQQDYAGFYRHEIEFRRLLGYPPFRNLIQILVSDSDQAKAFRVGERVAGALKLSQEKMKGASHFHILGPAAAPLEKLRGKYRVQVLLKFERTEGTARALQESFAYMAAHKVPLKDVRVDVDPLSLL